MMLPKAHLTLHSRMSGSRWVITPSRLSGLWRSFLYSFSCKEQVSFNFMAAVIICSDFGAPKNKVCHCSHCFPIYFPWSDGTSFTFIKNLFSSPLLSAISVVSSAYLRFLIFLPATLIPASDSSSLAFCMIYSAYKLNKQGDNIQRWHTPFLFGTSLLLHVQL